MYSKTSKAITVAEAIKKMERYCAYQERCHKEVEEKLNTFKLITEAKEKIILHLLEHNFINEERYAKSFARGKFIIKNWGKQRIIRELKFRNISEYNIKIALKEISDKDYLETFHSLAEKKYASLKETDSLKKKKKVIDYLMYRGWEYELIFSKVQELTEPSF